MFSWQLSAKSPSEMEGGRERGREGEREGKRERAVEREGERGERRDHLQVLMTWKQEAPIGSSTNPAVLSRRSLGVPVRSFPFWRNAQTVFQGGHSHGSPAPRQCASRPSASLTRPEGCALPHPPGTPWGRTRATKLSIPTGAHLRSRLKPTQPGLCAVTQRRRRMGVSAQLQQRTCRPPQLVSIARRPMSSRQIPK